MTRRSMVIFYNLKKCFMLILFHEKEQTLIRKLRTEESIVKCVVFFKYLGKSDHAQQVDRYRLLPSTEL